MRAYYQGPGASDPVVIEVPLGGYQPQFILRADHVAPIEPIRPEPTPLIEAPAEIRMTPPPSLIATPARQAPPPQSQGSRWAIAGAGLAATLLVGLVLGSLLSSRVAVPGVRSVEPREAARQTAMPLPSPLPYVSVMPISISGNDIDAFALAGQLQHGIADSIARFDHVRVLRGFTKMQASDGGLDTDYTLLGHFDAKSGGPIEASFRLLHSGDRRLVWSGAFNFSHFDLNAADRAALVRSIVTPVAQPFGAVASDLRSRIEAGGPSPKSAECVSRFDDYWETRSEAKRRQAYECVLVAARLHPNTSLFQVLLSNLYMAEYLGDLPRLGTQAPLDAAEEAAMHAIRISPGRAHPYMALSQALNLKHEYEKAVRLAERALEMNPLDTAIMAQLGSIYVLRGKLDQGGRLLRQALDANPAYPAWINFYLFLEAWLRDDKSAQLAALKDTSATEEPDVTLARVVAAAEAGNLEEARRALAQLRTNYPTIAAAPKAALERLTLAPDIIDRMLQSTRKVGL
jgi:tetratricopeptide (TPR) repeat protein